MKHDSIRIDIERVPASGSQRWRVSIEGLVWLDRARDPEHEIARLLASRGVKGRMLTYIAGRSSMNLCIEAAAGFTIVEGSATSLRRTRWQPFRGSEDKHEAEAA